MGGKNAKPTRENRRKEREEMHGTKTHTAPSAFDGLPRPRHKLRTDLLRGPGPEPTRLRQQLHDELDTRMKETQTPAQSSTAKAEVRTWTDLAKLAREVTEMVV